jgi:hypothetical protein
MFICEACRQTSSPGETSRAWVSRRRRRLYELLDSEGGRVRVVSGWEIVRELRLCARCHEEAMRTDGQGTEEMGQQAG